MLVADTGNLARLRLGFPALADVMETFHHMPDGMKHLRARAAL